ncbi:histidine kinase [Nannocystis sp. SCPEA4]|uniref:sensor histidine kinase n=1 Tax=Nannocystis sp. SCPEA4 TaxID=2996787 RepID=UPI00226D9F1A|nr:histidine kinase [Nannocystis sp. SCPEA4]
MSPRDRGSAPRVAPRPNLVQAFAISYGLWLLPTLLRWSLGTFEGRLVAYEGVAVPLLYLAVLAVIGAVYGVAARRGASLKAACAWSLLAAAPAISVLLGLDYMMGQWYPQFHNPELRYPHSLGHALLIGLGESVSLCALLAAIVFLPLFAREHEDRDRELELARRDAELLRVRTHLEPHFILNSLNAVAGLVEDDPAQARELLAALGDLLREATRFEPLHKVRDEITWLQRYVVIHEIRHPRLHATWDVQPETLDLYCPALILQPLVENAIKHGALRGGGQLAVRAAVVGDRLELTVEDDGPELLPERAGGNGLTIVRRRLEIEAAGATALELGREAGRTVARVRLAIDRRGEA